MPAEPCSWLCNTIQNENCTEIAHELHVARVLQVVPPFVSQQETKLWPALLRSPKGKSHYIPSAVPWARLSVICYVGWIQWQLPNVTGRTHLLHAKRTKCPAVLCQHRWWSHGTQLVLRRVWVCLKRIILHDKCIPWMLSSIHWDRKLSIHSGPWFLVFGFLHAAAYAITMFVPPCLSICVSLITFEAPANFRHSWQKGKYLRDINFL